MTVIESAVAWAIKTAEDNTHGYSQANRWGNPDYDCSSFVISAYEQAGVPLKKAGASYTGNMRAAFLACGFVDVTYEIGLTSGYGIQAGDVLLNYSAHTCISVGNGKVANCRTDEGHPQCGDQSGNEIRIQSYWNYPWNCVLRYKDKEKAATVSAKETHDWQPPTLTQSNAYNSSCVVLQALLNVYSFACGSADGFYGAKTAAAVNKARSFYGLESNNKCDLPLWKKLMEI